MANSLRVLRYRVGRKIRSAITQLVELPGFSKRILKIVFDVFAIIGSFIAAIYLADPASLSQTARLLGLLFLIVPLVVLMLTSASLYNRIAHARDIDILRSSLFASLAGGIVITLANLGNVVPVSLGSPVIFVAFLTILSGGGRVWIRSFLSERQSRKSERVIIYGAGEAGRQLLAALRERGMHQVMAFVDDDDRLMQSRIGGLTVFHGSEVANLVRAMKIDTIMLAMPSVSGTKRREILHRLEPLEQPVRSVPDIHDILSGKVPVSQVRAVSPEDLLGRDPVPPRSELVEPMIDGCRIMVTGAGGSIGSELCRQIMSHKPSRLVLVEQSEFALYAILQTLEDEFPDKFECVSAHLGTVEDETRMRQILVEHNVQSVFHTAAYKHVPLVETNVIDAVRNNAHGTSRIARAAIQAGIETFVLVSTDKAVRPANVMGASKRLAELVCQSFSHNQSATKFAVVRFGNVLDSSGSVAPLFREQIEKGGPVTVTHNEATRYFMTLREAAQLVIQAGSLSTGGDVFVLGMGEPVRITDLACRMIRLAGYRPRFAEEGAVNNREILITFTGLRPGEKLSEELFVTQQANGTVHPLILRENGETLDPSILNGLVARLEASCQARDGDLINEVLLHRYVHFRPGVHGDDVEPEVAVNSKSN